MARSLGFYGDGISFRVVLANHSNSESFLVAHALLSQGGCQQEGFWEGGQTSGVSFRPFPNSSGWWWLIFSVFLIRISCHKTTHANGYYGAWPGWAVSISVLPLTSPITSWLKQREMGKQWAMADLLCYCLAFQFYQFLYFPKFLSPIIHNHCLYRLIHICCFSRLSFWFQYPS